MYINGILCGRIELLVCGGGGMGVVCRSSLVICLLYIFVFHNPCSFAIQVDCKLIINLIFVVDVNDISVVFR